MYTPEFKGKIEGWTVNYLKREFWRVEAIMEWQDVLQEAYIVFMRCAAKYPHMDTPQHFMALYKRAWTNEFNDLSSEATKLRALVPDVREVDSEETPMEAAGELENEGYLRILVSQAPDEVRSVLCLMLNAPQELLDVLLADWRQDNRRADGGGHRINAALGFPPHVDVRKLVTDYLGR